MKKPLLSLCDLENKGQRAGTLLRWKLQGAGVFIVNKKRFVALIR
jgi:hypothetical protein